MRNETLLSKVLLSIAGGTVLATHFLISSAPLKDFFHAHESVSLLHRCFGLTLLMVLFWVGFFVVWVIHSLILWSAETLIYNIRHRREGEKGEQRIMQPTETPVETAPGNGTRRPSIAEQKHDESEDPKAALEDKTGRQGCAIAEDQSEEPLLTSEEFAGLIENSGLTIKQVAEELEISRQMVSYIIHGKRSMTKRISDKAREVFRYHR